MPKLLAVICLIVGIGIGIGVGICIAYFNINHLPSAPSKPKSVPSSAIWVGGKDGGVWVTCNNDSNFPKDCEVYADVTGVLVEKGKYELKISTSIPYLYTADKIAFRIMAVKETLNKSAQIIYN